MLSLPCRPSLLMEGVPAQRLCERKGPPLKLARRLKAVQCTQDVQLLGLKMMLR